MFTIASLQLHASPNTHNSSVVTVTVNDISHAIYVSPTDVEDKNTGHPRRLSNVFTVDKLQRAQLFVKIRLIIGE